MSDFLSALGDMGYVDGKNIIFAHRTFAAPTVQAMKDAIAELQQRLVVRSGLACSWFA
jgi:hypothetical protein